MKGTQDVSIMRKKPIRFMVRQAKRKKGKHCGRHATFGKRREELRDVSNERLQIARIDIPFTPTKHVFFLIRQSLKKLRSVTQNYKP